ncbi:TetR/AcrR family transcriptional regulator [Pseudonocardia lacus]|uniref:TetR/AcrR family transcriptional regulator n=1 Tax=Pseudonocardia lacus TaxID=2835865 RepID=UPI0027E28894|nr:TetR/AcrR family transcriptional regulator [Pseudonocardia lacus]
MDTGTRTGRAARMPPAERRAAIVAAALPLVLRHGAGVSTRQVAEAAGVAEGTIFRVFPDKEALMCAVTAAAFDPTPGLRRLAEIDRGLPLRERLVAATVILQEGVAGAIALIDALGLTGPPPRRDGQPARVGPTGRNDAFRRAVVDLIGDDEHRLTVPADHFAHVLQLLAFSGIHPRMTDGRPLPAAEVVGILLNGMARPAPAPHPHRTATEERDD